LPFENCFNFTQPGRFTISVRQAILEALKGDRAGQHSIRINDRYRLGFIWAVGDAYQVEITDYH
jgi:proteic killer suppression protein